MTDPGPTTQATEATHAPAAVRSADLVLAHLHLRLGSLALARAELETLAGRDALDDSGLVDLAEARWRTGDVIGAGEAAAAVLGEDGDGPLVALVVAAEAALHRGRPTEARGYATRALDVAGGDIDALFAGMPRGPVWPADATTMSQPAPTLFDAPATRAVAGAAAPTVEAPKDAAAVADAAASSPEPATLALWEALEAAPAAGAEAEAEAALAEPALPPGADALQAGRDALAADDVDGAATHLALALRLTPTLAPAVLEAIGERRDRDLAFVRGDAYRLVGREREARRAYADALRPIALPESPTDRPPEGDSA